MADAEHEEQQPESAPQTATPGRDDLGVVRDVSVRLSVEVGSTAMAVGAVMQLEPGAVVELDREVGAPADLLVNGTRIGRAEVSADGERLSIRVVELASDDASEA